MKENTYIYREIMDKLNESPMLVSNYLMSSLRCYEGNNLDVEQAKKCYEGLLEEYNKVSIMVAVNGRASEPTSFCATWWWWQAFYTRTMRRWTNI